jgi:hypothetical protein
MALRVWTGLGLGGSGALLCAASWQRWAGSCVGDSGSAAACDLREDHLYDFLPPMEPWEPAGSAAELGGLSLLVFAVVLPLLPWALTGRRPGRYSAVALVASELALVAVGVATLRSGLSGEVVAPALDGWSVAVWLVVPPVLVGRWAVAALGWARVASVVLILAMPLVAFFSYAIGSYDSRPWWEAISGAIMAVSALCLVVAAAWPRQPVQRHQPSSRSLASPIPKW